MREIKFRGRATSDVTAEDGLLSIKAWDWLYGNLIIDKHEAYIVNGVVESNWEYIALDEWCPVDIKTVGQYTGLKDKNGVGIYQGDLVRVTADVDGYGATSYGGIVEVTTKTCGYSFEPVSPTLEEIDTHTLYHDSGELMVWDSSSFWHVDEPTNLEVIGNIYENGNLLEANQ